LISRLSSRFVSFRVNRGPNAGAARPFPTGNAADGRGLGWFHILIRPNDARWYWIAKWSAFFGR